MNKTINVFLRITSLPLHHTVGYFPDGTCIWKMKMKKISISYRYRIEIKIPISIHPYAVRSVSNDDYRSRHTPHYSMGPTWFAITRTRRLYRVNCAPSASSAILSAKWHDHEVTDLQIFFAYLFSFLFYNNMRYFLIRPTDITDTTGIRSCRQLQNILRLKNDRFALWVFFVRHSVAYQQTADAESISVMRRSANRCPTLTWLLFQRTSRHTVSVPRLFADWLLVKCLRIRQNVFEHRREAYGFLADSN